MKRRNRSVGLFSAAIAAVVSIGFVFALFHGHFDHGQFEVKETNWSSSGHVAMVAERSDNDALSGLDYFVLIGDHVFSPTELRFAYHSDKVIFSAANKCLSVHWIDARNLTVTCRGQSLDSAQINHRQHLSGDVAITYVNIPEANSLGGR
jgi:hypothetical protein